MKRIIILLTLFTFLCANLFIVTASPATDNLDITVHKAINKPVIDGKITQEEWGEAVMYQAPGVGYTFYPDNSSATSANGEEANIYMLWDETGYYVAAVVSDPIHFNQYSNLDIWNGDAFEFDSNFNTDDYTDRNRQCYGLNNDGEIFGGSYKVASGVNWEENGPVQHKEYTAVREGSKTYYEFFVPWENFCPQGNSFAKIGNKFRGNVQFHLATDGDYIECQRYVLYDSATETSTYPNFILADAVSVAEPATDSSAVVESPKTLDNISLYIVILTAVTFAGAAAYKTKTSK